MLGSPNTLYNKRVKRAYGSEPVLLNTSPVTSNPRPIKTGSPKKRRKILLIVSLTLMIIGVAGYALLHERSSNVVPVSILQRSTFPLYTPAWLPPGMLTETDSFDATSQVVTFSVRDARGTRLVFTEQPRPALQEVSTFYDQQLTEKKTFKADNGEVTTGRFEGTGFAAVATDRTWVLVRAVADIDQGHMERIVRQLKLAE